MPTWVRTEFWSALAPLYSSTRVPDLRLPGVDYGPEGIRVNAICPGYVWTPLVENQIDATATARGITRDEVVRDVLLAAQPNKRFADVEELGALAVFLCGPGGLSMTGAALPVDGGWTAH